MGTFRALFTNDDTKRAENVKEDAFTLLNIEEMCSTCLVIYLEEYDLILSNCFFSKQFSIPAVVRRVHYMYSSLYKPLAGHRTPVDKTQKYIPQVCKQAF